MPEPATFVSLLTGSFSTPAGDNPTVAMVEAAYRHHGLNVRYVNCEVELSALGDAVRGARDGLGRLQLFDPAQGRGDRAPRRAGRLGGRHWGRQLRRAS